MSSIAPFVTMPATCNDQSAPLLEHASLQQCDMHRQQQYVTVPAGDTSAAVAALISLASPLPYSADFRPYFTIHDEDFAALAAGQLPGNSNALPRLLGVTNLYFLKVPN